MKHFVINKMIFNKVSCIFKKAVPKPIESSSLSTEPKGKSAEIANGLIHVEWGCDHPSKLFCDKENERLILHVNKDDDPHMAIDGMFLDMRKRPKLSQFHINKSANEIYKDFMSGDIDFEGPFEQLIVHSLISITMKQPLGGGLIDNKLGVIYPELRKRCGYDDTLTAYTLYGLGQIAGTHSERERKKTSVQILSSLPQ